MTFKARCEIAKGRIDPAPMVDIVFLLLIFLVLSSPYVLQPGFGTTFGLPTSSSFTAATFQGLVVTVSRDDLIFFRNERITLEKLKTALQAAARESRNAELVIKADQQVPHGTIVKIEGIAFEAGISAVNIAVRPEISPAGAPSGR
jgi:biopolymer transport protein ExbD